MDGNDQPSLSSGRSRRQKVDKHGHTFEKLKQLKGSKNKYEIDEVDTVWQVVDEKDYSKLVRNRQDDDWIVDDNGQGYVEDGREIFDDDDEEDCSNTSKNRREKVQNKKESEKNVSAKGGAAPVRSKNLKSMFASMPTKRKIEKTVEVNDDDLLKNILEDMHNSPITPNIIKPTVLKKKTLATPNNSPIVFNNRFSSSKISTPTRPSISKPMRPRVVNLNNQEDSSLIISDTVTTSQEQLNPVVKNEVDNNEYLDSAIIAEYENGDFDMEMDMEVPIKEENQVDNANSTTDKPAPRIIKEELEEKIENSLSNNWDDMCLQYSFSNGVESQLPSITTEPLEAMTSISSEDGEKIKFFWLDAYEDYFKHPGKVYLFGKIWDDNHKKYVSCCVTVNNIERTVFFLPREFRRNCKDVENTVTFVNVHEELSNLLAEKFKIMRFRAKKSKKKYCFEKMEVPVEAEYLEVKYPAEFPALPNDLVGETFSHVFGTNTSSLEQLLLDQRMKGPCWLEITAPAKTVAPISWCKVELSIDKPDHVMPIKGDLKIPPVTIMAMTLKTATNTVTHQNEIVAFSCMVRYDYYLDKPSAVPPFHEHICAVTRPDKTIFPLDFKDQIKNQNRFNVTRFDSNRAMLSFILVRIFNFDPDIIVGHDIVGFDFGVLLHQLNVYKIPNWSRLGRLRKSIMPKFTSGLRISEVTCGRLICDVKIMTKEVIRSKSYDLTALTKLILNKSRVELDVISGFRSSQGLLNLVEWSLLDANFSLHIIYELNVLPLALQITNIAGNLMSRTVLGGRSERNEYLLLHAFTEKGYIVPDKHYNKMNNKSKLNTTIDDGLEIDELDVQDAKNKSKRKATYAGGLVLEPKKGLYDKFILLMDFNSLYPSIIQEYNVCFTGMQRDAKSDEEAFVPDSTSSPGILPLEIKSLVESRQQVKKLLKSSDLSNDLKVQYDIRQKALKLTANSMYGCLGFANSRFYAKPLAAFITTKGREILLQTKNLVQMANLEVIYGDTDSIMINTNSTDLDVVMKLGNKVKLDVNKLYRHLEIEIDGIFKSMLLLKKKKYAALVIQKLPNGQIATTEEIKGVDIVRRDWSGLACEAGKYVISQILSDKQKDLILDEISSYLINLKDQIMDEKVQLQNWTITKQLTKNPEDYNDIKSLPHVNVALRLNSKGGKKLRQGDTVSYVICEDGSNLPTTQRAYHLDELKNNDVLKIDKNYYLSQQIHPVISRLCDPIEGMDSARIADALGLDPSSYRSHQNIASRKDKEEEAMLGAQDISAKEKFAGCTPFEFICQSTTCKQKLVMDSPFIGEGVEVQCFLSRCTSPNCNLSPESYVEYISCQLVKSMKQHIQQYYMNWMMCDDPMCASRTRKLPLRYENNQPICTICGKGHLQSEYTEAELYTQLSFYHHIFDVLKGSKTLLKPLQKDVVRGEMNRLLPVYNRLKGVVTRYLDKSDYAVVNFVSIFHDFPLSFPSFPGKRAVAAAEVEES